MPAARRRRGGKEREGGGGGGQVGKTEGQRKGREAEKHGTVVSGLSSWMSSLWAWAVVIALGSCLLHSAHLSILFENDVFFSHLSPLERELSFRTEMGLYYHYYKEIVEADSFPSGLSLILHDNTTEYPDSINTLQRFNLYPEVVLSALFRSYRSLLEVTGATGKECYSISRGRGQSSITACSGMGDSAYFYVHMIFYLNGLLTMCMALLTFDLSGSLWGPVLSLTAFFYNHQQATRVMWTTPLRESFAMPFFLLQMLCLSRTIKQPSPSLLSLFALTLCSLLFLLPWQFSQFTLLTQVLSLLVVYSLRLISSHVFLAIMSSISMAFLVNVVLQFGNAMLLTSFLPSCLLACCVVCLLSKITNHLKVIPLIAMVEVTLVLCTTVVLKLFATSLLGAKEDEHIGAILLSKFTSYRDFHTQLYTCAAEFDYMPFSYLKDLSLTLLLPLALVVMVIVGVEVGREVWRKWRVSVVTCEDTPTSRDCGLHAYLFLQTLAFVVMATLIMRLKVFLTPQLVLVTGLLPWQLQTTKKLQLGRGRRWQVVCVAFLCLSSIRGWSNLYSQWSVLGEFNNPEAEQLVHWIQNHSHQTAVFAGTMPTMATVLLTTGRPVVNHPHYENAGLRNRTKHVYTIFSRKPASEIHSILHGMGVNYVISEDNWCRKSRGTGCSFREMWDEEDSGNHGNPVFCDILRDHTPFPFRLVFSNSVYRVLMVAPDNHHNQSQTEVENK